MIPSDPHTCSQVEEKNIPERDADTLSPQPHEPSMVLMTNQDTPEDDLLRQRQTEALVSHRDIKRPLDHAFVTPKVRIHCTHSMG